VLLLPHATVLIISVIDKESGRDPLDDGLVGLGTVRRQRRLLHGSDTKAFWLPWDHSDRSPALCESDWPGRGKPRGRESRQTLSYLAAWEQRDSGRLRMSELMEPGPASRCNICPLPWDQQESMCWTP
jgi:hypothetical protein